MNFHEVTRLWGNATLIESAPGDEICSSVIYVPWRDGIEFHNDQDWGVYHRDGRRVQAASYYRGSDKQLVGGAEQTSLNAADLPFINEEFVYGGPFIFHFGHFLTASLSRFWHIGISSRKRRRILYHSHMTPDEWFSIPFVNAMLSAIGLVADDFVKLEEPCLIKRLWVPRPAMEEQNFIHRAYSELCIRIGHVLGADKTTRNDDLLYLSKTRLDIGVSRFINEHILEQRLAERGVKIIHPQELSMPEQIRLFASAKTILTTTGSALHTCLFLDRPSRILALSGSNLINSNFALIDRLKANNSHYFYPEIAAEEVESQGNFLGCWKTDMAAAADEFIARL